MPKNNSHSRKDQRRSLAEAVKAMTPEQRLLAAIYRMTPGEAIKRRFFEKPA